MKLTVALSNMARDLTLFSIDPKIVATFYYFKNRVKNENNSKKLFGQICPVCADFK